MSVNEISEKVDSMQKRVSQLVDEIHEIKTNIANFKSAVAADVNKLVEEVGRQRRM